MEDEEFIMRPHKADRMEILHFSFIILNRIK